MQLDAKLAETSQDQRVVELWTAVSMIMTHGRVPYFVFGSAALLSLFLRPHRLPGDLDIGVPLGALDYVTEALRQRDFAVSAKPGFTEAIGMKSRIHIVEGQFDFIDPASSAVLGSYDFVATFTTLTNADLRLTFINRPLEFKRPGIAETIFLCLLKPINTTTLHDFERLFKEVSIDDETFRQLCARSEIATALMRSRLEVIIRAGCRQSQTSATHLLALSSANPKASHAGPAATLGAGGGRCGIGSPRSGARPRCSRNQ